MAENRRNPYPWILMGGGVLLILAGLIWVRQYHPASGLTTAPAPTQATKLPLTTKSTQIQTPGSVAQIKRVSLEDAKAGFDDKTAIFLDVRDSYSYAEAHIPGAVNIPISDLTIRMGELDQKAWIITYCT